MNIKRFKEAFIKIKKNPMVFVINSVGLSLAISLLIILGLHIQGELSYDSFQPNKNKIVRVHHGFGTITPSAFGPYLTEQIPEIESYLRLLLYKQQVTYRQDEVEPVMINLNTLYADSTWSKFFYLKSVYGDTQNCLDRENSVVLTQSVAQRIFGNRNPLGKMIYLGGDIPMEVSAVVEDYPEKSMFSFDLIVNINLIKKSWGSDKVLEQFGAYNFETFLLLSRTEDIQSIEKKCDTQIFDRLSNLFSDADFYQNKKIELMPFTELYFSEMEYTRFKKGNKKSIRFYAVMAMFILLIAIINYVNIATIRSFEYLKSISIKKIYGANRYALASDIILEGILVVFLSSLLAILIGHLVLPAYSLVVGKTIELPSSIGFYALVLLVIPFVLGILVSLFPAFYLANYSEHSNRFKNDKWAGSLRNILSFLQFSGTIILLIAVTVIYLQVNFMLKYDTGINKENVLKVSGNNKALDKAEIFSQRVTTLRGAELVSFSKENPINVGEFVTFNFKGEEEKYYSKIIYADCHLLDVFDIGLLEGKNFSCKKKANENVCLINKAAADRFQGDDVLKSSIFSREVIGVVEDFNFASLHNTVIPLIIAPARYNYGSYFIKLNGQDVSATINEIKNIYNEIFPENIFEYQFIDEQYNRLYKKEVEIQSLIPFLGIFAIVISCLGLLSLSVYTTIKKTKEIGIHKVNGASIADMIRKLGSSTLKLVIISFVVACPLAYYMMYLWLEGFAFRISLDWWIFALAGLLTTIVALATVSWQIFKAARRNPVESLRYE